MTKARTLRILREVALTSTAVLGALCLLATLIGLAFDVRPLLFRSGSMAPAIHTGDMSLSKTVSAPDLRPDDVVSVLAANGERVTHRIVTVTGSGDARQLTLKGDANEVVDTQVYNVTEAQRVLVTIPKAGYVVSWFSKAPGAYVLALYLGLMLMLVFRRPSDRGDGEPAEPVLPEPAPAAGDLPPPPESLPAAPRRRRPLRAAVIGGGMVAGLVALSGWSMTTGAFWTDSVPVTATAFTSGTGPAVPTGITCTASNASTNTITIGWTAVPGATGYRVTRSGGVTYNTTGTSQVVTGGQNQSYTAFVQAQVGTGWFSANSATRAFTFGNGNNKAPTCD